MDFYPTDLSNCYLNPCTFWRLQDLMLTGSTIQLFFFFFKYPILFCFQLDTRKFHMILPSSDIVRNTVNRSEDENIHLLYVICDF